ncbi:heat shock protein DNAj [Niveomyces insectorum RCEF 264]|uniref:Heat shock protein DNAj n=1 Tax=Niveomyces insectorum RCEF 264 TaxID=1081102 RepID=A0A167YS02_9HYPO|nr:heat shock protein DNAj [Niveomyces insectorum RCEF 264]
MTRRILPLRLPNNHHGRPFHSSRLLLRDSGAVAPGKTHYETLNVPLDASMAEIKKSFYHLSKVHHPDHNPKDPHAPHRFMRLSEAYAVLGHADKRAVYDRSDTMRHHFHHHPHHGGTGHHRPNASYHSTGPAGGRPASGLSRRRSVFRGPPPSFYRNTGAGTGTAYQPPPAGARQSTAGSTKAGAGAGGFGPGNVNPDDAGTRADPHTPHFDRASNERTHHNLSARRAASSRETAFAAAEPSMVVGFLVISVALAAGVLVPVLLFGGGGGGGQKPKTTTKKPAAG